MRIGREIVLLVEPRAYTRVNILDSQDRFPTTLGHIIAHRGELQGQGLLVMGRDPGVEPSPFAPLAKNPPEMDY